MTNTFVIRTDDEKLKEAMSDFLSEYCLDNDSNAIVYDMSESGADKVMDIISED